MFRGNARLSIDDKGRVAIPSIYRKRLMEMEGCAGRLVVAPHWDGCLLIYPLPEWEIVEEHLRKLPNTKPAVRNLQRFLLGNAMDRDLDAQGRLLLTADLRERAQLDGQAMLVAQSNKFELWDEQRWNELCQGVLDDPDVLATAGDALESFSI